MTVSAGEQEAQRIKAAVLGIRAWMNAHGAPLLVENLAPGATSERLAQAESELGFALPAHLRVLWSMHDGQREEGNGFIEAFNLLSVGWALAERETVLMCIGFARESPADWERAGGTAEELQSDHWVPFAAQDSDSLAVSGVTGRVFSCPHDDTATLVAPSLVDWLERYAAAVQGHDYAVVKGFGDYYLQLRDRDAERRAQERAEREAERERFRRETPLIDQFRKALAENAEKRCTEVLEDALLRDDPEAFRAAVALLFGPNIDPKLVAGALRPLLQRVTLEPDQWVDVAMGGALLENHAVRDIAISRCTGTSADRVARLASAVRRAREPERKLLEHVLQAVCAKAGIAEPSPRGSWLTRLFGKRGPSGSD